MEVPRARAHSLAFDSHGVDMCYFPDWLPISIAIFRLKKK